MNQRNLGREVQSVLLLVPPTSRLRLLLVLRVRILTGVKWKRPDRYGQDVLL
jgi:hypothetical protein